MANVKLKDLKIGDVFPTNQGCEVTVIEITGCYDVTVEFNDSHRHQMRCRLGHLNDGNLKNPFHPGRHGIGFLGTGSYVGHRNGLATIEYIAWSCMLNRCYNPKFQETKPAYIGCSVHPDWHNFQNFAHWYVNHPHYGWGYQLDKDIIYPGNTLYSAMTCCLVPTDINNAFQIGVGYWLERNKYRVKLGQKHIGQYNTPDEARDAYLQAKQSQLITLAHQWEQCLTDDTYEAMLDYADNLLT